MEVFDPILLSRARLGIISVLMTRRQATFSDLRAILNLTHGNLGTHLQKLEEAGYVGIKKEFVARKPKTTSWITEEGRAAFLKHVAQLEQIARAEQQDPDDDD